MGKFIIGERRGIDKDGVTPALRNPRQISLFDLRLLAQVSARGDNTPRENCEFAL